MLGVMILDPCELNVAIAALSNHFYSTLSREDFVFLSIFLRELSKSMIGMTIFEDICDKHT